MHVLRQVFLTMVLLFIALVGLNMVRLSRAPAQVAPPTSRNGDVDCDGKINITDPLVLLNWLFSDGPEPCAIAQTEPCSTELLSQAIEELKLDVAAMRSSWPPRPENRVYLEGSGPEAPSVVTAYVVPEGKIFVLTDLVVPRDKEGQGGAEIREKVGAVTSVRWPLTIGRLTLRALRRCQRVLVARSVTRIGDPSVHGIALAPARRPDNRS